MSSVCKQVYGLITGAQKSIGTAINTSGHFMVEVARRFDGRADGKTSLSGELVLDLCARRHQSHSKYDDVGIARQTDAAYLLLAIQGE